MVGCARPWRVKLTDLNARAGSVTGHCVCCTSWRDSLKNDGPSSGLGWQCASCCSVVGSEPFGRCSATRLQQCRSIYGAGALKYRCTPQDCQPKGGLQHGSPTKYIGCPSSFMEVFQACEQRISSCLYGCRSLPSDQQRSSGGGATADIHLAIARNVATTSRGTLRASAQSAASRSLKDRFTLPDPRFETRCTSADGRIDPARSAFGGWTARGTVAVWSFRN